MCCFKPNPVSVSDTMIFASHAVRGRQVLVYSMVVTMDEPLAMILPIPVRAKPKDSDVNFINMEKYPTFFQDLQRLFLPEEKKLARGGFGGGGLGGGQPPLQVHDVGAFDASFVPTISDFDRLDARFQIEQSIWLTQPIYEEYGFVVFQLKMPQDFPNNQGAASNRPHPMAFDFPLRDRNQPLFFPTVHIHDGTMPREAEFDHILFAQSPNPDSWKVMDWEESGMLITGRVDRRRAARLIIENKHCFRRIIRGLQPNEDIWL